MSVTYARRRARPVADAPIGPLLSRVDDLAKSFAMALVVEQPLERLGDIPVAEIARAVPAACTGALCALSSDAELDRLLAPQGAALKLRALAGAGDPGAALEAVELLRSVLWRALVEELREPDPRLLADLAERLAHICARIGAQLVQSMLGVAPAVEPAGAQPPRSPDAAQAPVAGDEAARSGVAADGGRSRVVLVDELAQVVPRSGLAETGPEAGALPGEDDSISVRDIRFGEGPGAWVGPIGRRLARFEHDSKPFGVLLVDVLEVEPGGEAKEPAPPAALLARMEETLAGELGGDGSLTRERPGRYWVLSDQDDPSSLRALGERLERTVRLAVASPGRSFVGVVGIARAPEDGRTAAALAARADLAASASRAAGLR